MDVREVTSFWSMLRSEKRVWIALACAGFIGFVAGAVVL